MDLAQSLTPVAASLVFGGTLAATVLRCGLADCRLALKAIACLGTKPFDFDRTRAELAAQIQDIAQDGFLRAEPHHSGDGEFDAIADRLISQRSVKALHDEHRLHRSRRQASATRARDVLVQAAELAPVMGMAGTLLSLGSMSVAAGGYVQAIGMAVGTTFFGLVCAHFLFTPLAMAVSRRAQAEETARAELLDWLAAGLEAVTRPRRPVPVNDVRDHA